jgi:hypothetical protein
MKMISFEKVRDLAADVALTAIAWSVAYLLLFRFPVPSPFDVLVYRNMLWVLPLHAAVFLIAGLYRASHMGEQRHGTVRLCIAAIAPSLLIASGMLAAKLKLGIPWAVLLICPSILLLLLLLNRGTLRAWSTISLHSAIGRGIAQRMSCVVYPAIRRLILLDFRSALLMWSIAVLLAMWGLGAIRVEVGWRLVWLGIFLMPAAALLRGWLASRLVSIEPVDAMLGADLEKSATTRSDLLAGTLYSGVFLATVGALKTFDIAWQDFDVTGWRTLGYLALRAALAMHLALLCIGLGGFLLALPGRKEPGSADWHFFFAAFFLGASTFGLVFSAAGLLGWLTLSFALVATVPVAFVVPRYCVPMIGRAIKSCSLRIARLGTIELGTLFAAFWCAIVVGTVTLVTKGLYPLSAEPDVWAHYSHYYRAVLESGSSGPNQLWYHFFISKAAGLTFLAGLLSDALAAQLVAAVFFVVICLILFQLVVRLDGSGTWASLAVALFAISYDGTFHKHHVILTGYVAFLTWVAIDLVTTRVSEQRLTYVPALVASLYIGFYQPLASSLIFAFFIVAAILAKVMRLADESPGRLMGLAIAIGTGASAALTLNYAMTGLPEFAPLGKMMQFADREKVSQMFSRFGLGFFLGEQADIAGWKFDLTWLLKVFRYEQFVLVIPKLLLWILSAVAVSCVVAGARAPFASAQNRPWIVIGAFLLPAFVLAQAAPVLSTYRLFTFAAFFGAAIVIVLLKKSVSWWPHRPEASLIGPAIVMVCSGAWILSAVHSIETPQREAMRSYLQGRISFARAMHLEMAYPHQKKLELMTRLRQEIGPDKRIYSLNQADDANMAFPGRGLITEPSYDFGKLQEDIIYGDPAVAHSTLAGMGVNYFYLPIGHNVAALFSSLAFSKLFAPASLERQFQVAMRDGADYVLTWRKAGDAVPLPAELGRALELHQSDVVSYFYRREGTFARAFEAAVVSNVSKFAKDDNLSALNQDQITTLAKGIAVDARDLMRSYAERRIELPENRRLIDEMCEAVARNIVDEFPAAGKKTPTLWHSDVTGQLLSARLGEVVRSVIRNRVESAFAQELAGPILTSNARMPYAGILERGRPRVDVAPYAR